MIGATSQMSLGHTIREIRTRKKLTLRQVAADVGVSIPFLAEVERGLRSTSRYREIARALEVDESVLLAASDRVTRDLKRWLESNQPVLRLVAGIRAGLPQEELREAAAEVIGGASRGAGTTTPVNQPPRRSRRHAPGTEVTPSTTVSANEALSRDVAGAWGLPRS